MDNHELQIGSLWTEPNYRGMGLATCAIQEILRNAPHLGQVYWYIVAKDNHASIRVAEKNGFTLYGVGRRTERWNVSLLGTFELIQRF
jgi:RimJ/RimL family protein N-acetyltransferase